MSGLINNDAGLLEQYARTGSDPAFRELVERHLPMVYATALRVVAEDTHLAQDVAQTVFTELSRNAAALAGVESLGAWLHRVAYNVAAKAVRSESRRRARERTAMEIHEINESSAALGHWNQLAPVLDEALNQLDPRDRSAIVLRYLQSNDLRSIGAALGLSDDAAQKRIARALEKLREFLTRRGLTFSAVLLAATLDAGAKTTVPDGLAAAVASSSSGHAAAMAGKAAAFHFMSTKTRNLLLVILIVSLTGGLAWWQWRSPAVGSVNTKTPSNTDAPHAPATGMANTQTTANTTASATGAVIRSPTAGTTVSTSSTVTSAATKLAINNSANSESLAPGSAKGLHFVVGPVGGADAIIPKFKEEIVAKAKLNIPNTIGDVDTLRARSPLPIYHLNLEVILNGGSLDDAQAGPEFYYPFESSGQLVTGGTAVVTPTGDLQGMGVNSNTVQINPALNQLAANDQVNAGSYEVRILTGLTGRVVVWLKSDNGGSDLIYKTGVPNGSPGTLYTAADFLQSLRSSPTNE